MLNGSDSSHTLDRSNSTPNSQRLTSVTRKKGAARKKTNNGDQGSAVGVQSSKRIDFNQPQVSTILVGDDGQNGSGDG